MGGGPAMRAAGKLTGMGVFNGGLRGGISAAQPAEQALRNVSRPAAAVVSTATSSVADVAAIQKASRVADWDFAAVEEDLRVKPSPEQIARFVFDVPSTLQEAKDATADLKEEIDKVYGPAFGLPLLATSVCNAYKLPSESHVQSSVVSLVQDKKMWDTAMENNVFKELMVSLRKNAAVEDQESPRIFDESSSDLSSGGDTAVEFGDTEDDKNGDTEDGKTGDTKDRVNKFFQKVKKSMVDMVRNMSDIFQKFFGSSPAERTSADAGGAGADASDAGGSFNEKTFGAYVMGLVIMVITLVVLKRVQSLYLCYQLVEICLDGKLKKFLLV